MHHSGLQAVSGRAHVYAGSLLNTSCSRAAAGCSCHPNTQRCMMLSLWAVPGLFLPQKASACPAEGMHLQADLRTEGPCLRPANIPRPHLCINTKHTVVASTTPSQELQLFGPCQCICLDHNSRRPTVLTETHTRRPHCDTPTTLCTHRSKSLKNTSDDTQVHTSKQRQAFTAKAAKSQSWEG